MIGVMLRFRVGDYDHWLRIFSSRDEMRRDAGCLGRRVWRNADDPRQIVLLLEWDERARYEAFAQAGIVQTPEGRERGGIEGTPEITILTEAERIPPWPDQAP